MVQKPHYLCLKLCVSIYVAENYMQYRHIHLHFLLELFVQRVKWRNWEIAIYLELSLLVDFLV